MKTWVAAILVVLAMAHSGDAFMCYTQSSGSDSRGVEFCFKGSCYSVGASLMSSSAVEKGCNEEVHSDGCVALNVVVATQHTCFCNSFLCNASSLPTSPLLLLLLLPALVIRFL